ncbi:MAG: phage portal protein [Kiritimatiellae bacterium]|nr:phage portal protein [Kiritimatiellia bacterium]
MRLWPWRKSPGGGGRVRLALPKWMRARFDAAQTNKDNARHWSAAEFLSADAEADPSVRRTLRVRARYEVQNNSYARGMVRTLAEDTVGTGPRLQMLLDDGELDKRIEHDFQAWAKAVRLAPKLRTVRMARCQDGEAFIFLAQNPALKTDVKLDLQLIEADRVTDGAVLGTGGSVDGIEFDRYGNPKSYRVLKLHPGGTESYDNASVAVKAENMIHVFRQERPEQHRGIPEITAALPLFAHLRRFTLAVVSAAEAAADFSGILYTDTPASGEADSVEAMDTIQLERNMLLTMPGGWKMSQVDPKQPVTTYGEFKREILNEIARCLSMPFNIAAGNSSGYNYASGRLDHQTYHKALKVDRSFMETEILDRILGMWLREWALANSEEVDACDCRHVWFWDGHEHVDPSKEASAQEKRLMSHTTNLAIEYAKQGRDWEVELRQIAKERKLKKELGIAEENGKPKEDNDGEEE